MHGFTLVECVLYLTLFSILMISVWFGIDAIKESAVRTDAQDTLEEEHSFIYEKLRLLVSQTDPNQLHYDATTTSFVFESASSEQTLAAVNGMLLLESTSGASTELTDYWIQIENLLFSLASEPTPSVTVSYVLSTLGTTGARVAKTFNDVLPIGI